MLLVRILIMIVAAGKAATLKGDQTGIADIINTASVRDPIPIPIVIHFHQYSLYPTLGFVAGLVARVHERGRRQYSPDQIKTGIVFLRGVAGTMSEAASSTKQAAEAENGATASDLQRRARKKMRTRTTKTLMTMRRVQTILQH